jgi:peptidoglycan/LPS O-acetylase OafA/YrhL
LLLACVFVKRYVIFGCLCGACGRWLEWYFQRISKHQVIAWVLSTALIGTYFINNLFLSSIVFSIWIVVIEQTAISKLFSGRVAIWLGSISMGIFVLHWPIYNSVGAWMITGLYGRLDNNILFAAVFIVSCAIVIGGSILFKLTVDRATAIACRNVDKWITNIRGNRK